ncbi:kinase-like protein [Annulohypoxylon bovei var. microspora]|nr:kinase-like protein [Annulohypoxylon bovei var. microspora]
MDAAEQEAARLQTYFQTDPRFDFTGLIGTGSSGFACHVKYDDPNDQSFNNFIVKRAFDNEFAREDLRKEQEHLRKLRGARHIVQLVDVPDNPLHRPGNEQLPAITGDWLILEWVPNGTIGGFILRAANSGIPRLPNRLLWRFFLCLIRACIAMAWPENINNGAAANETVPQGALEDGGLAHGDLHMENVMVGDALDEDEHRITPLLKFIDFGQVAQFSYGPELASAVQSNIYDIGLVMLGLITFNRYTFMGDAEDGWFRMSDNSPLIETRAGSILPLTGPDDNYPYLDPQLRKLVCACLAKNHHDRPGLISLSNDVSLAVPTRTCQI